MQKLHNGFIIYLLGKHRVPKDKTKSLSSKGFPPSNTIKDTVVWLLGSSVVFKFYVSIKAQLKCCLFWEAF